MNRVNLAILFISLLFCVFEFAEGVSLGTIQVPHNPVLKTFPGIARKCFVFQWTADPCKSSNTSLCRTTVKLTTKEGNGAATIENQLFIPPTAADNKTHYQCVYDTVSENNTCCSQLITSVTGLKTHAMTPSSLDKAETVEFFVKNCLHSGTCAGNGNPFDFITPWRDPCHLYKPCGLYARLPCEATKPDSYKCTCWSDWEGVNCTTLKGFGNFKDKCFASSVDVFKTESNRQPDSCGYTCQVYDECRSFVFIPNKAGSKKGNCKLYTSTSNDYKLESCPGSTYYEKNDVKPTQPDGLTTTYPGRQPTTQPATQPSGAAVAGFFYPLRMAAIVNIVFFFFFK